MKRTFLYNLLVLHLLFCIFSALLVLVDFSHRLLVLVDFSHRRRSWSADFMAGSAAGRGLPLQGWSRTAFRRPEHVQPNTFITGRNMTAVVTTLCCLLLVFERTSSSDPALPWHTAFSDGRWCCRAFAPLACIHGCMQVCYRPTHVASQGAACMAAVVTATFMLHPSMHARRRKQCTRAH